MKIAMISALAATTLMAACSDNKTCSDADAKKASAEYAACKDAATKSAVVSAAVSAPAATDPNEVLVSVDGKKLTRGELDADIALFVEARKAQIPPERLDEIKKAVGEQMAQQFLMKEMLLGAAEKKGVKMTEAERKTREAEIIKSFEGRPGAPKSFDEMAARHPFGKERGLKELGESLLIQKLLDQEVTSKIAIDPKEIDDAFAKATAENQAQAQKAAGAEGKIKELAKQFEGLKGDALAKKFAEVAKANSDCPSKEKGGDLGAFGRGQMVKEFEEVAFSSEPGVVSAPVKTQFGWHLIMVTKKIPAQEAKGETPASPEKVQASHILVMGGAPQKAPSREDIEKGMKRQREQMAMQAYFEKLRSETKIEAPGFPRLMPPPAAQAPAKK